MGRAPNILTPDVLSVLQATLKRIDANFTFTDSPKFASLVNYSSMADEPIHRWFRYREGYSTNLVSTLLSEVPQGGTVVDPFCGSGTTLLVASQYGYPSVGIDASPLSVFVARVKTRNYSAEQLRKFEEVYHEITKLEFSDTAAEKPQLQIIDKVFLPEVLRSLLILKHFITTHLTRVESDFFLLAWLCILEEVSNVYKEGNGIKYRNRKRTPSGYEDIPIDVWQLSMFPEDKFDYVVNVFLRQVTQMISDVRGSVPSTNEPCVFEGDAISLNDFVAPNSASLVAFSPPYLNNFNYFKAYKVELWMGDFIRSYPEVRDLTRRSLRSHVETQLVRNSDAYNEYPDELNTLIDLINPDFLWTPRLLLAIKGYFYDMRKVLQRIFETLEPGGRCVIVVGNSAYGSILIPTDSLLAHIAVTEGLQVDKIAVARHLTTSSQQKRALEPLKGYLRESLLFLKKPIAVHHSKPPVNGSIKYHYVGELPRFPQSSPPNIYVIQNRGLTDATHAIHKFPGKFIPHVPRWAIGTYLGSTTGKVVLDPFCGSGTSLVEAHLSGHMAFGLDIDPLARLISKVKTTVIDAALLEQATQEVEREILSRHTSHFRPSISNLEHWFSDTTCNDLGVIREVIEQWKPIDADIYDFLIVCMSAIIRRVSNADNQSLKTYVSGTHRKQPSTPKPLFLSTLKEYAERIGQFAKMAPLSGSTVVLALNDARTFADDWLAKQLPQVHLGVTSPPYIKTIDYIYNQMAEHFWVGDLFGLENQPKQNAAKKSYIGTEKVVASEYRQKRSLGIENIDSYIDRIYDTSAKHGHILYSYFNDMKSHFEQMHRVLNEDGTYVVVIGDSEVSNVVIPTHELLTELAETSGFCLVNQTAYEIRNRYMRFPRGGRGGIVDLDWVLAFRKVE
jgi:DNA modification methylase